MEHAHTGKIQQFKDLPYNTKFLNENNNNN